MSVHRIALSRMRLDSTSIEKPTYTVFSSRLYQLEALFHSGIMCLVRTYIDSLEIYRYYKTKNVLMRKA